MSNSPSRSPEDSFSVSMETESASFGQYQLLRELGSGGMGTVYHAIHRKLDREVALKVLSAAATQNPDLVARFEREMKAVGKLNHANIVTAHDAGEVDGVHYLAMELVKGSNMEELVKQRGPLPTEEACEVIRQAALGLQHAYENGLVHRDLKPSNIMVTEDGAVKVLDLGLAMLDPAQHDALKITQPDELLGTLDYMAPEQADNSKPVDIRADLYGLGATLYELLTGKTPLGTTENDSLLAKFRALLSEEPTPIEELRPDLPDGLVEVIQRLLAKSPEDRPATPTEVADLLAPFCKEANLQRLCGAALKEQAPSPAKPPPKRKSKLNLSEQLARLDQDDPLQRFCERLEESELLSPDEVTEFRYSIPDIHRSRGLRELVEPLIRDGKLTGYQAALLIQEETPTLYYGPYLVLDQVGAGSMGTIYRVKHRETGKIAALKVLANSLTHSSVSQKRFEWEIKLTRYLSHENIVNGFDTDTQDGQTWFAMEFVDGIDLSRIVKREGALRWKRAVRYAIQAARGLAYAHRKGVTHRDVKPSNLLLGSDDQVKLLDLGIARYSSEQGMSGLTRHETLTGAGQVLGTADYLAPEQAGAEPVDRRADIYSLGCTLFYLLVSLPPYRGQTALDVIQSHKSADVPRLRDWLPHAPAELERILLGMMAKAPANRYQSMEELLMDLEPLLEIEDEQEVEPEPPLPAREATETELLPSGLRPLEEHELVARASTQAFPEAGKRNYARLFRDWGYWLLLQAVILATLFAVFYYSPTFPIENSTLRLALAGGVFLFHHLVHAIFGYLPDEFQPRTLIGAVFGLLWGPLYYYLGGPYLEPIAEAANWFLNSAVRIELPPLLMMSLIGSIVLGTAFGVYRGVAGKSW